MNDQETASDNVTEEAKSDEIQETKAEKPKETTEVLEENKEPEAPKKTNKFKRLLHSYATHKKITIPLTILFVLLIVLAVPFTRYSILGLVIKKNVTIKVVDSTRGVPVTDAQVIIAGKTATTNEQGEATANKVSVGNATVEVSKTYYQTSTLTILVPLGSPKTTEIKLVATGRQVPINVTNIISGDLVSNLTITAGDSKATTDDKGNATIVVPADATKVKGTIEGEGYIKRDIELDMTQGVEGKNDFAVTPAGKIYFLSKKTGKIDVVKTNLDGTQRETVYAGTGKEDQNDTILLASTDWKYLVLKSKRDSGSPKLYLIETATDKVTTIDEGNAQFDLIGWYDEHFSYSVTRNGHNAWEAGNASIKSYNADTKKLSTIDTTDASGSNASDAQYETYTTSNIHFLGDRLVYTKLWYRGLGYTGVAGRQNTITSIKLDGSDKKVLGSYDAAHSSYVSQTTQPKPDTLYIQVSSNNFQTTTFYRATADGKYAEDGGIKGADFDQSYPTFLISPSEKQTFWSEPRDGKNTLLIGSPKGTDGTEIASLSVYKQYGWYGDYLLVSKDSSELYVMANKKDASVVKVSDYHKPAFDFSGYGGGYGGL